MQSPESQKAYDYSLKLLAIRKRSIRQLHHRLIEKGFDEETTQAVVSGLVEQGLLNDEEFARSFVAEKAGAHPAGRLKLEIDLRRKGVGQDIARRAVSELDENYELETALRLGLAKAEFFRNVELSQRRKKVYDYLKRKGYRIGVCREVMTRIKDNNE